MRHTTCDCLKPKQQKLTANICLFFKTRPPSEVFWPTGREISSDWCLLVCQLVIKSGHEQTKRQIIKANCLHRSLPFADKQTFVAHWPCTWRCLLFALKLTFWSCTWRWWLFQEWRRPSAGGSIGGGFFWRSSARIFSILRWSWSGSGAFGKRFVLF